jgi:hypothetical protein
MRRTSDQVEQAYGIYDVYCRMFANFVLAQVGYKSKVHAITQVFLPPTVPNVEEGLLYISLGHF